jgi:RHS repeat-associated protein
MKPGVLTWVFAALGLLPVVHAHAADTVYYYSSDTIHSEVVVTDQNRNVVERTHYAPYGQVLNRALRDGPGYTSHEEDPATGLVYMQQRYYDPQSGRFLSTDPVGVNTTGGGNFNRYWYANDNPYRYTDPTGMCTGTHICNSDGTTPITGGYTTGSSGAAQGMRNRGRVAQAVRSIANMAIRTYNGVMSDLNTALNTSPSKEPLAHYGAIASLAITISPIGLESPEAGSVERAAKDLPIGETWGNIKSLVNHFFKHGSDFGANNAEDYAAQASKFLVQSQRSGLPTKIDVEGVIRTYDARTNTFGAYNPNGTTRTFFTPDRGQAYWDDQPGSDPWNP